MDTSDPYSPLDVFERNIKDGRNFLNNNEIAKAAECFEKAYDIKSNEPELPFVLASLYRKLKNPDKCERFFRKTIALKPSNFEYLVCLRNVSGRFFTVDDAVDYIRRCIKLQPDNAQLLNDLGVIYSEKQDFPAAIDFLLQSSEKNPDYLVPLINLGHLYLRVNDLEKAEQLLDRLMSTGPAGQGNPGTFEKTGGHKEERRERARFTRPNSDSRTRRFKSRPCA